MAGDSATFYTVVACIAAVFVYLGASLIGFAAVLIKLGILFRSIADCDRTQYCSPANLSLKFMYAWTTRDCLACVQFLFNMVRETNFYLLIMDVHFVLRGGEGC